MNNEPDTRIQHDGDESVVDALAQVKSQLKPDGPPVNYEALHLYIAGDLDEDTSKRVWQHIATWRAWWDAWQEEMLLLGQEKQTADESSASSEKGQ